VVCACHETSKLVETGEAQDASLASLDDASVTDVTTEAEAGDPPAPWRPIVDAKTPARYRYDTRFVLMCWSHTTWQPPEGFVVEQTHHDVVAHTTGELAGLVFVPHSKRPFEVAAARYIDGTVTWDEPQTKRIDDWHATLSATGVVAGYAVSSQVELAGLQANGEPRTTVDDFVLIAVAHDAPRAEALMATTRKGHLMLVDHACVCGTDCYPARPR